MIKEEAQGCVEETGKAQPHRFSDTKELEDKLKDPDTWVINDRTELILNIGQSHELLELKERLDVMIKSLESPLKICQENLVAREARQGAELVRDIVEESLQKEIEVIRRHDEKLQDFMEKLNIQLTRLRAARHDIEADIRNKDEARKSEDCIKYLSKLSTEVGGPEVLQEVVKANAPPSTSYLDSQNLIQRSQDERSASQILYSEISKAMISAADECFVMWYETNAAFNTKIIETSISKRELEKQLLKIRQEIQTLIRHINNVRRALEEKIPELRIAQARLEKRKQRHGLELCKDKTMAALYKEIYSLKQGIELLHAKLQELEGMLSQLMRTKSALEHDISQKEIALFIDHDKCLSLRNNFPISTFKETRYPKRVGAFGIT